MLRQRWKPRVNAMRTQVSNIDEYKPFQLTPTLVSYYVMLHAEADGKFYEYTSI